MEPRQRALVVPVMRNHGATPGSQAKLGQARLQAVLPSHAFPRRRGVPIGMCYRKGEVEKGPWDELGTS